MVMVLDPSAGTTRPILMVRRKTARGMSVCDSKAGGLRQRCGCRCSLFRSPARGDFRRPHAPTLGLYMALARLNEVEAYHPYQDFQYHWLAGHRAEWPGRCRSGRVNRTCLHSFLARGLLLRRLCLLRRNDRPAPARALPVTVATTKFFATTITLPPLPPSPPKPA